MRQIRLLFTLAYGLTLNSGAQGYENIVTHQDLTEKSVQYSILASSYEAESYLSQNLGMRFQHELNSIVNGSKVLEWFKDGANFEDGELGENACRASNHFHNPIKGWQSGSISGWEHAQMTDGAMSLVGSWIDIITCSKTGWSPETRKSSVTWATEFLEPVADGARKAVMEKQLWSWGYARNHFYEALTAPESATRELAFSNAFRAIGQVIHLIQDSAQPAHVRNDFDSHLRLTHIGFERPDKWGGSQYERYVELHTELVTNAVPIKPNIENPSLTDFWDTNLYDGTAQLSGLNLGLTEYTNANYFSDETIPNNVTAWWRLNKEGQKREHLFPYPTLNADDYELCTAAISYEAREIYIARKSQGGCASGNEQFSMHFAQVSLLNDPHTIDPDDYTDLDISKIYMTLDNKVYKTYAKELLPLAIGYSSALIDYFFRGRLGVISKHNGLTIKNNTDEQMSAYTDDDDQRIGKIEILYDRADGSRHLLAQYNLNQPLAAGEETPLISFALPADNITPGRYIVVFKGRLGKEEGAVMAKVVSPKIYYVAQHSTDDQLVRKIMRMEADGQHKTVVFNNTDPDFVIGRIAISPDARTLVFSGSHADGPRFLYTLDISDGRNKTPKRLTEGFWPDWSPDGSKLVFQRSVYAQGNTTRDSVLSYEFQTSTVALLAGGSHRSDSQPAWSSSQNKIAYITNAQGEAPHDEPGPGEIQCGNLRRSIELMDASGNHMGSGTDCLIKFYITPDAGAQNGYPSRVSSIQQPVWSPDENEIMYVGTFQFLNTSYTGAIDDEPYLDYVLQPFKININTQQETALFKIDDETNIHHSGASSWSMDGKTIAVTRMGLNDNEKISLSRSHIVLIDADTGDKIRDLTTLDPLGSFYPDFGY